MLKKLLIPSVENDYTPFFSTKAALVVFTLWILIFNIISTILLHNYEAYAHSISSDRIIALTNEERKQRGLPTVQSNALLTSAAYAKANNMFREQYWDHFGPNGETPWQFIKSSGYEYSHAGENLGKGFTTSEGLHQAWMASITHRDNIINANYTDIGIAIVQGNLQYQNIILVVQLFGRPSHGDVVLGDASFVQSESKDGNLKSIMIVYPEDGKTYGDSDISIKGVTENISEGSKVEIIAENQVIGDTKVDHDSTWLFERTHDWNQGKHDLDAVVKDGNDVFRDSVNFTIDSIPPGLVDLTVTDSEEYFVLNLKLNKVPAKASIISGDNIINFDVNEEEIEEKVVKNRIKGKVFLVLSDEVGNVSETEITKYFPVEVEESAVGSFFYAPLIQKIITVLFGLFILVILVVQVYHYRKLGMLKEKEGDFLMLGLWWLILLFGAFIGYSGTIA